MILYSIFPVSLVYTIVICYVEVVVTVIRISIKQTMIPALNTFKILRKHDKNTTLNQKQLADLL